MASGGDQHRRVASFHGALSALRSGRSVLLTADSEHGERIAAPLFGGTIALARGAFSLSRLSGVPMIPLVARWEGTRIRVVRGTPLSGGDSEDATARAAAQWLEGYLRAHPEEVTGRVLELSRRTLPRTAIP